MPFARQVVAGAARERLFFHNTKCARTRRNRHVIDLDDDRKKGGTTKNKSVCPIMSGPSLLTFPEVDEQRPKTKHFIPNRVHSTWKPLDLRRKKNNVLNCSRVGLVFRVVFCERERRACRRLAPSMSRRVTVWAGRTRTQQSPRNSARLQEHRGLTRPRSAKPSPRGLHACPFFLSSPPHIRLPRRI